MKNIKKTNKKHKTFVEFIILILLVNFVFFSCAVNSSDNDTGNNTENNSNNNDDDNDNNNDNLTVPDHIPITNHPRLWLTEKRLNFLKDARNRNTEEWAEFIRQCDYMLDNDPDNDPYEIEGSPQMGTAPLALAYKITGEGKYADMAMTLMDNTPSSIYNSNGDTIYGDPDHHGFHYLGLAYDWLYDYSKMTNAKKESYIKKMLSISDSFWKGYGLEASGTDSDANLLSGMTHLVLGTAIYGDNDRAGEIIDRGWDGWEKGYGGDLIISNKGIIEKSLGGVYPTGFSYFTGTDLIGISGYWMSFLTAYEYDVGKVHKELAEFWPNLTYSLIQLTEPNRTIFYPMGSWQDPSGISDQAWFYQFVQIGSFFNKMYGKNEEAKLLKGYAEEIELQRNGWFTEFFFGTEDEGTTNPFNADLPLIRFADEPDFLIFRNSWEKQGLTWGIFIGDGSIPLDHQSTDQGHFSIWKGDGFLTSGARTYEALTHGDFFNTLSIQNNCSSNGESCSGTSIFNSQKTASISRHSVSLTNPLYAYSMLEADGQWNDNPSEYQANNNVKTYRRHFLWMNDYFIIFDRVRTKNPVWIKYRLRAITEPKIRNNIISQTGLSGKYKLLSKILEPSSVNYTIRDENALWNNIPDWVINYDQRHWQTIAKFNSKTSLNILNIIQTGNSSLTAFDFNEKISSDKVIGVHIGNLTIVFSKEENMIENTAFTINNANGVNYVFIADLNEGDYKIKIGSTTVNKKIDKDCNLFFEKTESNSNTLSIQIEKN